MVTLGEVLSLPTLWGAFMGKVSRLWISRSLVNVFATIVNLKMLSDTDTHTKPQPQSPCTSYISQISLYINLLTRNSIQTLFFPGHIYP